MLDIIKATKREILGKKVKLLAKDNLVPCVVYGPDGKSESISVSYKDIEKLLRTAKKTTILSMDFDDKTYKVLIKEVQRNIKTDEVSHVAFYRIDENKEMLFEIPIELEGVSLAVKNNLGNLLQIMSALQVKCKLGDLVPVIKVDISGLDHPGQSVKVKELALPEKVRLFHASDIDSPVVTITQLQEEKVEKVETAEAAPEEGATEETAAAAGTPAPEEKTE